MRTGITAVVVCAVLAGIAKSASPVTSDKTSIEQSCNVVPLLACGDPAPPNPMPANWHWLYGYSLYAPMIMKLDVPGAGRVGPGNVELIKLPGGWGPEWISQNSAAGYNGCLTRGSSTQRQRGNKLEAVAQGLDTRFGTYLGPMSGSQAQYPPDVVTTQTRVTINKDGIFGPVGSVRAFDYSSYEAALKAKHYINAPPKGQFNRRILSMPVGDCSGSSGGSSPIPIIGFVCFFLLQEPIHQGNTLWFIGQFVWHCDADGTPASTALRQAHASTQGKLDRVSDTVQADRDAVDSTEEEIAQVENELRKEEKSRTLLLPRLQQARAKQNCARPSLGQSLYDLSHPVMRLAPGNMEGVCQSYEAQLEMQRSILSSEADSSPENLDVKHRKRVIHELEARINSGDKQLLSPDVVWLETDLKDVEAQIGILNPQFAELREKLSKLQSRLQLDGGR
jgi:hypothetical protein